MSGINASVLKSFLSANGLTSLSPPEEIRKLLGAASYSSEEIAAALALLSQPAAPTAQASMNVMPPAVSADISIPAPVVSNKRAETSPDAPLTGAERTTGIILLLFLAGGVTLMAYKVLGSLLFVIQGYEASPGILSSLFLSYMGPAFVGALVLLFISWRIARMFYKTRSYSLWLSLVVGIIIIFWFLLLFTLLPAVLAFVPIPSGMGFAISLLLGIALNFVHVSVLVCILLATLVSVFRWNKGKGGKGLWAPIIATVLATGMLVAFSGALKYPAQALGADMLCYGVLSKTERSLCLASSFVPSEDAAFDIIQIPFSYPHAFAMVGGRFVFIAQEKEDDGMRTKSDAVYADGVRLPGTGSIFGFQDVGDGRIAYVVSAYESGDMTGSTLFLEDEEIASGDRVALIPGTGLTYLFSDAEATYVTKEGKIVAEGEEAQEYFAARRAEWLAVQNQPSDSITLKRDDEKREMTYTIGDMTIVHAQDGLYANGKPLMRGFSTWPPTVVEGKVVLGAFGMGTDMKLETYIIAEKGLLSEEVRARLEAL